MKLEVLHVPDCPNLPPMLERLAEVTSLPVTTRVIDTDADAVRFGMAGSPTLLIDGVDPFTAAGQCECGVSCRLYRDERGRMIPAPSVEQLRDALTAASRPVAPGEVLSAWRTRALPLDPVEKAAHQAILRAFAATGRAPADWLADYELIEGVPGLPTAIGWRHGVVRRHLRCGDRHQRFWWQDVLRG